MSRIVGLLVVSLVAVSARAEIIYRPRERLAAGWAIHEPGLGETGSADEVPGGIESFSKIGQRVAFGGSSRFVTRFDVDFIRFNGASGDQPTSLDVTIEIWEADGDAPGALIWSGSAYVDSSNPPTSPGLLGVARYEPNITLPDAVFTSVSYSNVVQGPDAFVGVASTYLSIPPAIPAPPIRFFEPNSSEWQLADVANGPFQVLSFEVEAIPSPATLALLPLGLIARRRRR